jgi:O-antigen ligase
MSKPEAITGKLIFIGLALFAFSVIYSVSVVEGALLLTLGALLTEKYKDGSLAVETRGLGRHPLFIPWMSYLGVCLLTAALAMYPAKAFGQFNSDFIKYLCLATLIIAVKKDRIPVIARFYVVSAAISGIIGIWRTTLAVPGISKAEEFRARAFMNSVRYGEIMAIALLFIIVRLVNRRPEDSKRERIFYAATGIPVFVALIWSQTRGAYLGFAVGMLCLFIFGKGLRLRTLGISAILAVIMAGSALLNPQISERFTGLAKPVSSGKVTDESLNMRFEFWKLGLEMYKANPVFGIGPDNIKPAFTKFRPNLIFGTTWGSLHNLYVQQAAERGTVGIIALLYLFLAMFLYALRRYWAAAGPFTLWAVCALPAFYAMNLTEISFQHVHTSFAIFMALAFAAAASRPDVDIRS